MKRSRQRVYSRATVVETEAFLEERRAQVDRYLFGWLLDRRDPVVDALLEAIVYALEGGKRVRAVLAMEAAKLGGTSPEQVLPTATAVECFHAYSLVHDDLPAMDDARARRGQPALHLRYGEATAILVGDSLIPLGYELLSCEQPRLTDPERVLRVMALFSGALGWRGLAGGQHLDLMGHAGDSAAERTPDPLWPEVHRRKTAALIEASLAAGAILAGMGEERLAALRAFGACLGRTYQAVDDLMDWEESDGFADLSRYMSREEAKRRVSEGTEAALRALEPFGERAERLRTFTRYVTDRRL